AASGITGLRLKTCHCASLRAMKSDFEVGSELFCNRYVLEPHVLRQATLERRKILAAQQRRKIGAGFRGDAESIRGYEIAWQLFFDIGDFLERDGRDFPAIRLVRSTQDCGHHRVPSGDCEQDS